MEKYDNLSKCNNTNLKNREAFANTEHFIGFTFSDRPPEAASSRAAPSAGLPDRCVASRRQPTRLRLRSGAFGYVRRQATNERVIFNRDEQMSHIRAYADKDTPPFFQKNVYRRSFE